MIRLTINDQIQFPQKQPVHWKMINFRSSNRFVYWRWVTNKWWRTISILKQLSFHFLFCYWIYIPCCFSSPYLVFRFFSIYMQISRSKPFMARTSNEHFGMFSINLCRLYSFKWCIATLYAGAVAGLLGTYTEVILFPLDTLKTYFFVCYIFQMSYST